MPVVTGFNPWFFFTKPYKILFACIVRKKDVFKEPEK